MTSFKYDKPFDINPCKQPLEEVHGGDLAIGTSLENWVSGEIDAAAVLAFVQQQPTHAYLPLMSIHPNGWSALRKLQLGLMDCYRIEGFESASRYQCPYTSMEFWGLVPLGVLAKDAEVYRKAFTAPGTYAGDFDWVTKDDRETHISLQLGEHGERTLDQVLSSVTIAMLGSGYTQGCIQDDGGNERALVTVDFENGDQLLCVAWIWFNK